jgi:two-component system OmpR family sensor kinase
MSRAVPTAGRTQLIEARAVPGRGFALVGSADIGAATAQSLQRRVALALLIGLLAAVIGGLVVARLVTRPLRRTAETARAMGAGSRQTRAPVAGPSEVADVATAVNELADALQHSESRQRQFLTSVSHELRTPLAAISGQAEALSDGIVPGAEVPQVGRTIRAESARLERLVSDLLDLARLGADSFRLEVAPCDVAGLLREMATVWQVRCDQRGVALVLAAPPGPVVIDTDARRLRQVLDGLAENALRLLGTGSVLVLGLAVADRVVLEVRDSGPGLAPEDYPVAFEQGLLHERYRGRRPGGAGLGLALAASLVTRLGGTITAGPAVEGGACMRIELP